jgi:type IV fimbrial biogenesis protein FimT
MTLIELIVVVAILVIVLGAAAPSFKSLMASSQLTSAKNLLVLGLQRARSEAVASGREQVLCPSRNGLRCEESSEWSSGWLLFSDNNHNGRFDPTEPLLLSQTLDPNLVSVHSTSGRRRIVYRSLGESPGTNVTFVICARRSPDKGGQVIVSNSGRVRTLNFAPPDACTG